MKNTLTDLNNYLFEAIERLNDDSLDETQLDNKRNQEKRGRPESCKHNNSQWYIGITGEETFR